MNTLSLNFAETGNVADLVALAEKAREAGDYKKLLELADFIIKIAPGDQKAHEARAEALLELRQFQECQAECLSAFSFFGDDPAFYFIYARASFLQDNFKAARDRFLKGAEKFPQDTRFFAGAAQSALKLQDFGAAAKIIKDAKRMRRDFAAGLDIGEEYWQGFQEWAGKGRGFRAGQALGRWLLLAEIFPDKRECREKIAREYLKADKFAKARDTCAEALAAGLSSPDLAASLIIAYAGLSEREQAARAVALLAAQGGDAHAAMRRIGDWAWQKRDAALLEIMREFPEALAKEDRVCLILRLAQINCESGANARAALREAFEKTLIAGEPFYPFGDNFYAIVRASHFFGYHDESLGEFFGQTCAAAISDCCAKGKYRPPSGKIAFLLYAWQIRYFAPVLRHLPRDKYDIIAPYYTRERFAPLEEEGLGGFAIIPEMKNLQFYKCLVADASCYYDKKSGQTVLNLIHAADVNAHGYARLADAVIVTSKKQATFMAVDLDMLPPLDLASLSTENKCEIAWTGPYHLGGHLGMGKSEARKILREKMGLAIPDDRPALFFLEDEVCAFNQIAYCLNKLARRFTVIYKPGVVLHPADLDKISSNVHIIKDGGMNSYLFRLACDYVCASYYSGSLMSSAMLGQPFLCYYSRLIRYKSIDRLEDAWEYWSKPATPLPAAKDAIFPPDPKTVLLSLLAANGMLFDLARPGDMIAGIESGRIDRFFAERLKGIQAEVFGDYMLEDAAEKTAAYIERFFRDGTFGDSAVAIELRERRA